MMLKGISPALTVDTVIVDLLLQGVEASLRGGGGHARLLHVEVDPQEEDHPIYETAVDLLEDGHLDVVVHLQGEEVLQET
jgi:hypothetical protein